MDRKNVICLEIKIAKLFEDVKNPISNNIIEKRDLLV